MNSSFPADPGLAPADDNVSHDSESRALFGIRALATDLSNSAIPQLSQFGARVSAEIDALLLAVVVADVDANSTTREHH